MIQKKSLKDAIQNPEIISVVGGLLGNATTDKDGLMKRNYVVRKLVNASNLNNYHMFKITGHLIYSTIELIANTDDGRMLWCTVTYSGYTGSPIKPALIKNKNFSGYIKFFRKEGEVRSIYIQLFTGSNVTSLFARDITANFSMSVVESSDESPESLIEIPMS